MDMLVIGSKGKLDKFIKNYMISPISARKENVVYTVSTVWEANHKLSIYDYEFIVLDLEFILENYTLSALEDLFDRIRGKHITAAGTNAQYRSLDQRICRDITAFYNLDHAEGIHAPVPVLVNKQKNGDESKTERFYYAFLYQLAKGKKYSPVEMDNLARHMQMDGKTRTIFVVSVDFFGSSSSVLNQVTTDFLEKLVLAEDHISMKTYFIPNDATSFLGLVSFSFVNSQSMIRAFPGNYCRMLRYELQRLFENSLKLTLGMSSLSIDNKDITRLFREADNAGFARVYEGAGKDYLFEELEWKKAKKIFPRMEHIMELKHSIEIRSMEDIRQTMEHLFGDVQKCRLEKTKLQGLLMEIMSMIFQLCVEEEISISQFNVDGSDMIDFAFIQNIESVEVEYITSVNCFEMILKEIADKKEFVTAYSNRIRKAIDYIYKHYDENIRLKDIADALDISPNYLCSLFKKETGIKVIEYINAVRIEKAKDLITNTNDTASQIAESTGFSDMAYFCTVFKKQTGFTVTEFRNRYNRE